MAGVDALQRGCLKKHLLLVLTVGGVILGVALGMGLRYAEPGATTILLLSYPGELFIRMLKLMILPLVIASLIAGSASLNANLSGSIVAKTVGYFLATSFFNAILGILLAIAIKPGVGLSNQSLDDVYEKSSSSNNANILDGFLDLGRNLFPDNLFVAAFQQVQTVYKEETVPVMAANSSEVMEEVTRLVRQCTNSAATLPITFRCMNDKCGVDPRISRFVLPIGAFSLVFGTVLGSLGKRGSPVTEFFAIVDEVILKIVTGIMWLSPVGVASVIMSKILAVDKLAAVMSTLALFIVTVIIGVFLYQLVFQNLLYLIIVRKNPFKFYFNLLEAWVTAFATASTAATLPITFRCMNDKCGVDPRISRFVLPIGATVNMDGTALFVAVGTCFIAQINERVLGIGDYATIAVTATAASVASASVPSAALFLILIVLTAVDLPSDDVTLFFTVDWLV
ncbi:excitatory amino acid transporter 2-like [Hyalella azteca]|uniref:Amino acid transporter n=1 Tax=Hyalella azteca TaxID=294128 RepID=A0A8B7NM22_HYAAZ|nr:excitatory amino acid transporter 2-like [Hyalella azteca]